MNPRLWWYVARAAGLVSWVLLAMASSWPGALLALAARPRPLDPRPPPLPRGLSLVFGGSNMAAWPSTQGAFGSPTSRAVRLRWNRARCVGRVASTCSWPSDHVVLMGASQRIWRGFHMSSFCLPSGTIHISRRHRSIERTAEWPCSGAGSSSASRRSGCWPGREAPPTAGGRAHLAEPVPVAARGPAPGRRPPRPPRRVRTRAPAVGRRRTVSRLGLEPPCASRPPRARPGSADS